MNVIVDSKSLLTILLAGSPIASAPAVYPDEALQTPPDVINPQSAYLFLLHGRIAEMKGAASAVSAEHGFHQYKKMPATLAGRGLTVIGEARGSDTKSRPMPRRSAAR